MGGMVSIKKCFDKYRFSPRGVAGLAFFDSKIKGCTLHCRYFGIVGNPIFGPADEVLNIIVLRKADYKR